MDTIYKMVHLSISFNHFLGSPSTHKAGAQAGRTNNMEKINSRENAPMRVN